MTLPAITPEEAQRLLADGAILVDIREPDEHARQHIPGARHLPLSRLDEVDLAVHEGKPVIFHCRSGARTLANAGRLAERSGACDAYVVAGGLDAWRAAGLPIVADRRRPIELQRQVQIGAGGLVLGGTLLSALVSPLFLLVPGFVGAGLIFAGASGFCGMAHLLMRAPWNRTLYSSGAA
jgi:rhodanese-related sulfurtransferase